MDRKDMEKLSTEKLILHRNDMREKMKQLTEAAKPRRKELKKIHKTGDVGYQDYELELIKKECTRLNSELAECNQILSARRAVEKVEGEARKEVREKVDEIEKEILDDGVDLREIARKLDELRPAGMPVTFGSEFNKCSASARRLIAMMAREIGWKRYHELRAIAYFDEKHQVKKYYYPGNGKNCGNG